MRRRHVSSRTRRARAITALSLSIFATSVAGADASPRSDDLWKPFLGAFRATTVPVLLPDVAAGFPAFRPPFRRSGATDPGQVYPTVHAERDRYTVTLEQVPDRCDGAIACVQMTIVGAREPARDLSLTGTRVALANGVVGYLEPSDRYGHAGIVWKRGTARYEIVNHGFGTRAVVAAANSALERGPR